MRARQRGFALPAVMLLLILASVGSMLIVTRVSTTRQETAVQASSVQALWAVEGALETVAYALRRGTTPPQALRIGGHDVAIDVERHADRYVVHARTDPTIAEVRVTLDDKGHSTSWTRLR